MKENPQRVEYLENNFKKLNYHIPLLAEYTGIEPGDWIKKLNFKEFNEFAAHEVKEYLDSLKTVIRLDIRKLTLQKDSVMKGISAYMGGEDFVRLRSENYNDNIADIVLNRMSTNKIYDAGDRLIQKADPVFMHPGSDYGRSHFFAPYKMIGNFRIDTLIFNIAVIWFMTIIFFITLYFNVLKRFIKLLESLNIPFLKRFGREFLPF
jgi:hypothetical protein